MNVDRLHSTLIVFALGLLAGGLLAMMSERPDKAGASESLYATCLPVPEANACAMASEEHHVWHYESGYLDAKHGQPVRPLLDFEPGEIEDREAAIFSYLTGYADRQRDRGYGPIEEP